MNGYPGYPGSTGYAAHPSRLGVRPTSALVQRLLVGAFGWMFAGLLLTAAVSFLVTSSPALTPSPAHARVRKSLVSRALAAGILAMSLAILCIGAWALRHAPWFGRPRLDGGAG